MKKMYLALLTLALIIGLGAFTAHAGKPVDSDGDGVKSNQDCNDNNPDVYPGAPELCDGIDNQCPADPGYGQVDEGCGGCTPTGIGEDICNGIDDDCDTLIDEDYAPTSTNCGVGVCEATGSTTCVDGVEGDTCTPGLPTETPEQTCSDSLDNDCDGDTDSADSDCGGGGSEDTDTLCSDKSDNDSDGLTDCADPNCDAFCAPPETEYTIVRCNDSLDNDNDGLTDCADDDCKAICAHDTITGTYDTPAAITAECVSCHSAVATDAVNSLHGMKATPAPNVTNTTGDSQKLQEINTFCSYPNPGMAGSACLGCHPTLGKYENLQAADLDCLRCHNDFYKRKFAPETDPANYWNVTDWQGTDKTYIPSAQNANGDWYVIFNNTAMGGLTGLDLIKGVHKPSTTTCLSCHAKAGGGDWTKRGDIGLSTARATASEDVHLASVGNGGAGLTCSDCHVASTHEIPGRGIDLRPSEGGNAKECVECHAAMAAGGHASKGNRAEPDRHVQRVSCKSCHIPAFGKGGNTELWRDWTTPHWNQALCNGQGAWAGEEHKEGNVAPDHVFFDGTSYVYELGQVLSKVDPISGLDLVADANGDINGELGVSMLVPIKRHQSNMAVMNSGADTGKVIPFDVVWQFMTGEFEEAAEKGKAYAGYSGTHDWINLEAEMAINHGVSPAVSVAACTSCHQSSNLTVGPESKLDKLGYALKDADNSGVVDSADQAMICSQCHREKNLRKDWEGMHTHTAKGSGIGCTFCHDIERPERGLCEPCNPDGTENTACINEFVDTNYFDHCTP